MDIRIDPILCGVTLTITRRPDVLSTYVMSRESAQQLENLLLLLTEDKTHLPKLIVSPESSG